MRSRAGAERNWRSAPVRRLGCAPVSLTRIAVSALIAGLCVAAAAAIAALLTGDFSDTHTRIVGTSLGFSAFTGIGAVGDALRREATGWRAVVGSGTSVLALLACILLVAAIWL